MQWRPIVAIFSGARRLLEAPHFRSAKVSKLLRSIFRATVFHCQSSPSTCCVFRSTVSHCPSKRFPLSEQTSSIVRALTVKFQYSALVRMKHMLVSNARSIAKERIMKHNHGVFAMARSALPTLLVSLQNAELECCTIQMENGSRPQKEEQSRIARSTEHVATTLCAPIAKPNQDVVDSILLGFAFRTRAGPRA